MRDWLSDIIATAALVFILSGVNDQNPYQTLCIAIAAGLGVISYLIRKNA
jgi:hypothetical protein